MRRRFVKHGLKHCRVLVTNCGILDVIYCTSEHSIARGVVFQHPCFTDGLHACTELVPVCIVLLRREEEMQLGI